MYQGRYLSIDRQAEQIVARDRLIRQLSVLALALSAIVFILAIMLLAATRVYASEACMSKAQARAKWPTQHIWFHTSERCWDNHPGRGRHYGKRNPEQAKPHPAPPARADANGVPAKKILWPALKPTIEFSFQAFLIAEPMTLWPPILDVDEVTADSDPPICCWPKLDRDFETRWNDMPQWWIAKLKDDR